MRQERYLRQLPRRETQCRAVLLIAVLNLTIESAPTISSEKTTFEVTARITKVDIIVSATRVTPKLDEYITPAKVFL